MSKLVEVNGKDYIRYITRFRNQEDLDEFALRVGLQVGDLHKNTTELYLPERIVKNKKPGKTRGHSKEWQKEWKDMPHFVNEKNEAYAVIKIFFDEEYYDLDKIKEVFDQDVKEATTSLWMPKWDGIGRERYLRVIGGSSKTKYPIYIISKGRHDINKTSYFFTLCEVPHYIVVEEQEYDLYMSTLGQSPYTTILILDKKFQDEYETLCDYENDEGETRKTGPGAARNFCWWHSMQNGFAAHHVIDDNSQGFHVLYDNCKLKVRTGAYIRAMEDFFDRHDNIAMCGPNYSKFALQNEAQPAYIKNTRIYSWQLIRNDLWNEGFRWRATWNEDTILSLDFLTAGYATVQFNFFLQDKASTQTVKGGNTEEFYAKEGTLRKSQILADVYPEYARVVWKFSRVHHEVNYAPFANNPLDKNGAPEVEDKINDYGAYLVKITPDEDHQKNKEADTKSALEAKYPREKAILLFDGTGWQNGFDVFKDFNEKGY